MTSGRIIAGLFLVVFLTGVAVKAPASVLRHFLDGPAFNHAVYSGSLWSPTVSGIRIFGAPHSLALKGTPYTLLSGAWSGDMALSGARVTGRGQASFGLSGTVSLGRAIADISIPGPQGLPAVATVAIDHLTLAGDGLCTAASGRVESRSIADFGRSLDWQGPVLDGTIDCEDGRLVISADGQNADGDSVSVRFGLNGGRYSAYITVNTSALPVVAALGSAGFSVEDGGYRLSSEGDINAD